MIVVTLFDWVECVFWNSLLVSKFACSIPKVLCSPEQFLHLIDSFVAELQNCNVRNNWMNDSQRVAFPFDEEFLCEAFLNARYLIEFIGVLRV
jgi:hypothetical protein